MTDQPPGSAGKPPAKPVSDERRSRPRARITQQVRIRAADVTRDKFEEVRTTINVSRDGLYFSTESDRYSKGMRVATTCPYSPNAPTNELDERIAEVVRVDQLSDGLRGVAVRFVSRGIIFS